MQRSLIIALLLMLLTVVLTIQNSGPVTINLLFWTVNMPIAVLILITVILGALVGALIALPVLRRKNEKIKELAGNNSGKKPVKESELK